MHDVFISYKSDDSALAMQPGFLPSESEIRVKLST